MHGKHFLLKTIYGYSAFRDGQESLIDALIAGQDTLGIMPTGGGKSICFQIPTLLSEGIGLVISPLISLMSDQVATLKQLGVAAAYINSSLTPAQQQLAIRNASRGMYKIIYVAPERLELPEFLEFARSSNISLLIVDEAHCVSQWGHDFRPSYLNIKNFVTKLPNRPPIGAFTATATEQVKNDIILQLGLQNPHTLTTGFDRPNLYFEIQELSNKEKDLALLNLLVEMNGKTGIIYCSTRKYVESICEKLISLGYPATRYHAGLSEEEKRKNLKDFLYDTRQIMVATNAFGMGIDKGNVSFVIHYNMPRDLESYYQEAGRAGRDGADAKCIMLFSKQDIKIAEFLIENSFRENDSLSDLQKSNLLAKAYSKLNDMSNFSKSNTCLRQYILHYFGQKTISDCGNCSVCKKRKEKIDVLPQASLLLETISKLPIHYGTSTIIKFLQGFSQNKTIRYEYELSTFGSLKSQSAKNLEIILDQLVEDAYLKRSDDKYRVLSLGYNCNNFTHLSNYMCPQESIAKKENSKTKRNQKTSYAVDKELFDKLSAWRKGIALQRGVPPFVVLSNACLEEISAKKPQNTSALREISGIGENKMLNYGFALLNIVKEHSENPFA